MSRQNIIRAWKDQNYRSSLSDADRAAMPVSPAGVSDLSVAQLNQAAGDGNIIPPYPTAGCTPASGCTWAHC
jgi:mersacidin/lichenicidin family type 2 lantibiotic